MSTICNPVDYPDVSKDDKVYIRTGCGPDKELDLKDDLVKLQLGNIQNLFEKQKNSSMYLKDVLSLLINSKNWCVGLPRGSLKPLLQVNH